MTETTEKIQNLETALRFAVIKWSANSSNKNEARLLEIASEIVELSKLQQLENEVALQAALFFNEGDFSRGDKLVKANVFVDAIQKQINRSMEWLTSVMEAYNIPVRP